MMHGHATITLTDPTTGQVTDRREEDNIVTDVIKDMMRYNPFGVRDLGNGMNGSVGYIWPLAEQAYGGILLFGETNTEDAASYWPGPDNPIRGYASMDNTTVTDPMRGTYNEKESGPVAKGYRWVYDWPTDRGNGEIKSISLTHRKTGQQYWGNSLYGTGNNTYSVRPILFNGTSSTIVDRFYTPNYDYPLTSIWCDRQGIRSVTASDNDLLLQYIIAENPTSSLHLTITGYAWDPDTFGLTSNPNAWGAKTTCDATIPGNWARCTGNKYGYKDVQYVGGNWAGGILHLYKWAGNESGDATITHATVTTTGTVNVETITSPVQLAAPTITSDGGYQEYNDKGAGIIRNGYLTAMGYGHTRFWRIPLNDPSHPQDIPIPSDTTADAWRGIAYRFTSGIDGTPVSIWTSYGQWTLRGTQWVRTVGTEGSFAGHFYYVDSGNNDAPHFVYRSDRADTVPCRLGPYTLYLDIDGNNVDFGVAVGLDLRYIATVNNLAEPVTKTSDRTMKITYTLTEA